MTTYTITLPQALYESLAEKARENFRDIPQQILYQLHQKLAPKMSSSEEAELLKFLHEFLNVLFFEENSDVHIRFNVSENAN